MAPTQAPERAITAPDVHDHDHVWRERLQRILRAVSTAGMSLVTEKRPRQ